MADVMKKKSDVEAGDRATWGSSFEFILTLLGYAVGLSNMLRFPYVCMKNGGGAFLIPYFTCIGLVGVTLMFLEMAMGQIVRKGCVSCWDHYAPVFKGVGIGMALVSGFTVVYYQTCYSWILYYIYQSFTWELSWTSCNNTWNTDACVSSLLGSNSSLQWTNDSYIIYEENQTTLTMNQTFGDSQRKFVSSTEEFFHRKVLDISDGIEDMGGLKTHLVISNIIGWVIIYACICRGVKSVGKVVYVTATAPYIFILIFLTRAALLPGSLNGVLYFITPNFQKIADPDIWMQAFIQVFFSIGGGWGGIITMASYNKYNHPFHREAILVPLISSFTSLLCGFLVFSVSGFLAHVTGSSVADAVSSGPGLAFVSYPEVAGHMSGGPVWSALFFIMLLMTGADSQFVTFETCVTAITDELRVPRKYLIYVITCVTLASMLVGLVFLTGAGMYIFQAIDWYLSIASVFLFAIIECLTMVWIYGYKRLFNDIRSMIGFEPLKYLLIPLWGVVIPVILSICQVWSLLRLSPPTYGDYVYPSWIPIFGWFLGFSLTMPTFIVIVCRCYHTRADSLSQKLKMVWIPPSNSNTINQTESFL